MRAAWRLARPVDDYAPAAFPSAPPSRSATTPSNAPAAPGRSWRAPAGPPMNGSAESLCHAYGTILAGLVGRSPFRSPSTKPAFRPQVGGAVTESCCVRKILGLKFRRTSLIRKLFPSLSLRYTTGNYIYGCGSCCELISQHSSLLGLWPATSHALYHVCYGTVDAVDK